MDAQEMNDDERDALQDSLWAHWQPTCDFFCHDPADRRRGVKLPGFLQRLPPISMIKIFCVLRSWATGKQEAVYPNRDEEVAKVGVVALCWGAFDSWVNDQHTEHCKRALRYGLTRIRGIWGVQCPCPPSSLTYDVCLCTVRGPTVIFAKDCVDYFQWVPIIGDMFDNSPAGPSSDGTQVSFMSGAGYFGGCLSHAPLVAGQQPLSPKDLVARVRTRDWMPAAKGKVFKLAALRNKAMVQSLFPLQQGDSRERWGAERCILLINIHRLDIKKLDEVFSNTVRGHSSRAAEQTVVTRMLEAMNIVYMGGSLPLDGTSQLAELSKDMCSRPRRGRRTRMSRQLQEYILSM